MEIASSYAAQYNSCTSACCVMEINLSIKLCKRRMSGDDAYPAVLLHEEQKEYPFCCCCRFVCAGCAIAWTLELEQARSSANISSSGIKMRSDSFCSKAFALFKRDDLRILHHIQNTSFLPLFFSDTTSTFSASFFASFWTVLSGRYMRFWFSYVEYLWATTGAGLYASSCSSFWLPSVWSLYEVVFIFFFLFGKRIYSWR